MATEIKCPNCGHLFALGEAEAEEYKKELQQKMTSYVKQKEEEFRKKAEEFEKQKFEIEAATKKAAEEQWQVKMRSLEEEKNLKTKQLQDLQKKELDLLREKTELETRNKNLDIEIEKRLLEDRKKIEEETSKREQLLFDLKMKEKDTQLDSLKKTIEELKRKSEQGSMQLQGEAQELLLEDILKELFPYDKIEEVGKGVEGADCLQVIRNNAGKECGAIVYESKRTKGWSNAWIEKLKADMRNQNADVAILVTKAFPKDMDRFGLKDGIWICSFTEISGLAAALRDGIIRVYEAQKSQENRGDKMHLLYDYLTGLEFRQQVEAIVEGFMAMKQGISKERIQMEKLWKEREKQIEKVLLSTSGMYGSIKGIAGTSVSDIPLLDGEVNEDDMAH